MAGHVGLEVGNVCASYVFEIRNNSSWLGTNPAETATYRDVRIARSYATFSAFVRSSASWRNSGATVRNGSVPRKPGACGGWYLWNRDDDFQMGLQDTFCYRCRHSPTGKSPTWKPLRRLAVVRGARSTLTPFILAVVP